MRPCRTARASTAPHCARARLVRCGADLARVRSGRLVRLRRGQFASPSALDDRVAALAAARRRVGQRHQPPLARCCCTACRSSAPPAGRPSSPCRRTEPATRAGALCTARGLPAQDVDRHRRRRVTSAPEPSSTSRVIARRPLRSRPIDAALHAGPDDARRDRATSCALLELAAHPSRPARARAGRRPRRIAARIGQPTGHRLARPAGAGPAAVVLRPRAATRVGAARLLLGRVRRRRRGGRALASTTTGDVLTAEKERQERSRTSAWSSSGGDGTTRPAGRPRCGRRIERAFERGRAAGSIRFSSLVVGLTPRGTGRPTRGKRDRRPAGGS